MSGVIVAAVEMTSARDLASPAVSLVPMTRRSPASLVRTVEELDLAAGQDRYVLPPALTLAPALEDVTRTPFAIVRARARSRVPVGRGPGARRTAPRADVVGFGVLDRRGYLGHLLDQPERTVLLRAYCIAAHAQGNGYGSAGARAVRALAAQVSPSSALVVLSVHEENGGGRRAYASAGFIDTTARYDGRSGPELVLAAAVSPAPGRRGHRAAVGPSARATTASALTRRSSARRS